ncbi:amino acid transporter [Salipaludibacillus agaradhaerens]|uniref:Amino acid transporter n=1 Tax=Salipaludibacillus agaradhaerens TaxID=76935 RepID=A0A9Q4B4H3_SALAG|nr:LysE/ArgO family amino acid transporter [Salipaludibacillus agaradhaerens]MCR6098169.1 amino acid transporter [Salipaludibacillus agaradhaerens]MCR6104976.1 amino acid transporter [Salipaludibacillus agaradhaerens]MCR6116201.1 amino acid transporter [Salipaludibacillus agaradhaerens]MCR6117021.1 amino acid transporter [Salipaludibacillus agaradhaerens]
MLGAILHGMILSFGLILPLGPQNIFLFNQGAAHSKVKFALPAVITASLCDTFLIVLAVLGVSVIVMTIPAFQLIFFAIGFFFLIYIGWSIWNSNTSEVNKKHAAMTGKKQAMFAISVSILNPHAVLDTVGVIGTSSIRYTAIPEKIAFAAACILVSWVSFFALAYIGKTIRSIDKEGKIVRMINKVSAIMIWGVSLFIGYQLYKIIF